MASCKARTGPRCWWGRGGRPALLCRKEVARAKGPRCAQQPSRGTVQNPLAGGWNTQVPVRESVTGHRQERAPPPQPWGRPRAHDAWGGKQTQKGMWSVSPRGWPAQNGLLHTWEGGSWAPGPGHHSWWGWDFLLRWRKVLESGVSAAWESHLNKDVSRKTRGRRY